jgi:hypothetical protein
MPPLYGVVAAAIIAQATSKMARGLPFADIGATVPPVREEA